MRGISVLLLLAPLVLACSHFPRVIDRVALVDQLVQQQEFSRAQDLLADLDTSDPQFAELANRRRALHPLIEQFEANTIRESELLQAQQQWVEALAVLERGMQKLTGSEPLSRAREQLLQARTAYLDAIEAQLQVLQGRLLSQQAGLLAQRASAKPDNLVYRWQLLRQQQKSAGLVDHLLDCAEQPQADAQLAADCLNVARSLDQSAAQAQRLARLQRRREPAGGDSRPPRQTAQVDAGAQRQLQQLKREYRDLVAAGWWLAARDKMLELKARAPASDKEVESWSLELQEIIDSQVQLGIKQGQALYSQGFLQQALHIWRRAADLAPDNVEVQAHIGRVQRFLQKLDQLHGSEG